MNKKLLAVFILSSSLLVLSFSANAQYSVLYSFNGTDGAFPHGDVSLWNGLLYGMTSQVGTYGGGTVFYADTNGGNLTDIYNFAGPNPNGGTPIGGNLTRAGNKLYGMTTEYGKYGMGCVFSVDTNGNAYQDLWDFQYIDITYSTNGAYPYGSLTLLGGKLYGMTEEGGIKGEGNIFSIDTNGTNYTDLYNFTGGSSGENPEGGALLFLKNKFYAMTANGGAHGSGNIFSIDTNGNGYKDLWDFNYDGTNGAVPLGGLITSNGILYGMTSSGGGDYDGNIFSIDTTGNNYTDLLNFNNNNGASPSGDLSFSGNKLFGMTYSGGANHKGTIFSIDTTGGNYVDLYNFDYGSGIGNFPYGSLTLAANKLYGMTQEGGTNDEGAIFSIDTTGADSKLLYSFGNNPTDGKEPQGSFILSNGNLYGMTTYGGAYKNGGTIISIDTTGSNYTQLCSFSKGDSSGNTPYADLIRIGNKVYGTTEYGGFNTQGNIFSMDTNGANYKDLWDFNDTGSTVGNSNGANPYGSLLMLGGKLYGMTEDGGYYKDGNIFSIDTNGSNYTDMVDFNNTNGANPYGSLIYSAGKFYGMTNNGGANGAGCIFSLDSNGSNYNDIWDFYDGDGGSSNGANPYGSLSISGSQLFGMTYYGGSLEGGGNVFSIDTNGSAYKDLYDFDYDVGGGIYGEFPNGNVTVSGGVLFGMTSYGGAHDMGLIFSVDTNGSNYQDLFDFNGTNGEYPEGSLTLSGNGVYGMTQDGGSDGEGTVFHCMLISDSTSDTSITCNGANNGHATVYVVGGTTPFTYLWSNGGTTDKIGNLSVGTYSVSVTDYADLTVTASITITQPNPLGDVIASVVSNVTCNSDSTGSATVTTPSGGTTPYTYMWSDANSQTTPTATGLSAGTYTITATDGNGCNAMATVTITQPSELRDSISYSNITCNRDTTHATVLAGGGTSPYTYLWSDANSQTTAIATGLSAGTYSVSIHDNCGADSTWTITITQPSELRDSVTINGNITCNGDSVSATANVGGGTTPYTYVWSDANSQTTATATGLSAGTYSVSIKDNCGADSTWTITITQPSELRDSVTINGTIHCNGDSVSATANVGGGNSPYTYLWSDANSQTTATATGLVAGTYSVSIKDACGADSTWTITITQPSELRDSVSFSNITCNGDSVSATANVGGGNSPYTYMWSDANSQTTATATGLSAGTYSVSIKDACGADSTWTITITQPSELRDSVSFSNITCNGDSVSATANVGGGNSPYTYLWSNSQTTATATGLIAGTYSVSIKDACGADSTWTITITQPSELRDSVTINGTIHCNGDSVSATANVTGGNSPYTYMWSDANSQTTATATGLSAGTYSVSIHDNCGADSTWTITITQPSELRDSVTINGTIHCNGDSVSATANVGGGNSPYTYMWSNSQTTATASGLSAGTYSVSIKDNCGADSILSITITQPIALNGLATIVTNVDCGGGNGVALASASGGTSPYTYTWSNGESGAIATGLSAGTYSVSIQDACGADSIANITLTQASSLTVSASATANIICYGTNTGSATSSISGGVLPYNYLWSNGGGTNATATGLSAGTYTVTVTDACGGSPVTASVVITQPDMLSVSSNVIANVSCNGSSTGSATSSASGGTYPYTYLWSDANSQTTATATGLSAGTYSVSIKDNCGADSTLSITITQPVALNGSAIILNNVDCGGINGVVSASASGGNSPYTYTWSNGESVAIATGLSAGTYSVSIQDACGADSIANITLTQASSLTVSANVTANINCNGTNTGSASSSISGGIAPYNYLWSNGGGTNATATGLSAGTYTVTVTDACGGAPVTASVVITEPTSVSVSISSTDDNGTNNGSATVNVSGGVMPYTYLWTPGDGTTSSITGLNTGSYCCDISDANGCTENICVTVNSSAGINNISNSSGINIYPDPTIGNFTVAGVSAGQVIELYNYLGEKLSSTTVSNNTTMHFDISGKANGIYLIRILNSNGTLVTEKKMVKTQ